MYVKAILNSHIFTRLTVGNSHVWNTYYSYSTDAYLESLLLNEYTKRELCLAKYFGNNLVTDTIEAIAPQLKVYIHDLNNDLLDNRSRPKETIVNKIETLMKGETNVPNSIIYSFLVYFAKNGNVTGISAVQSIVKKYNISNFNLNGEYNHYMAEALWIDGKIIDSLKLFSNAYDNRHIQSKVKSKMSCLFPLLTTKYSEATLWNTVYFIEQFSSEKQDVIIYACLWKALFESEWYSDQQISHKIIQKNEDLLQTIQWMIPMMGRTMLQHHKIIDFYRLIEFALEKNLKKPINILLQLLFDYYFGHRNIERCTAVVKYCQNLGYNLTECQQERYIHLLLNHKHPQPLKRSVKTSPTLKYTF